jgi:hypothetical protein
VLALALPLAAAEPARKPPPPPPPNDALAALAYLRPHLVADGGDLSMIRDRSLDFVIAFGMLALLWLVWQKRRA